MCVCVGRVCVSMCLGGRVRMFACMRVFACGCLRGVFMWVFACERLRAGLSILVCWRVRVGVCLRVGVCM